jgi:hypothetical protein
MRSRNESISDQVFIILIVSIQSVTLIWTGGAHPGLPLLEGVQWLAAHTNGRLCLSVYLSVCLSAYVLLAIAHCLFGREGNAKAHNIREGNP